MATDSTILDAPPVPGRSTLRERVSRFGPGLALAVASVGAGDMITALDGAETYGLGLAWTVVIGVLIKYALTEAVGRLQLSSDRTFMGNVALAGRWLPALFLAVVFVVALLYGAGLSSVAALAVTTFVPGLPALPTTIAIAVVAGVVVLVNRYSGFEALMIAISGLLVVGMAILAVASVNNMDSPGLVASTATVSLPDGSIFAVLALLGGVGGGVGLSFYGYWIKEKGWSGRAYLGTVRRDTALCYATIFLFFVAMSVMGTALLFATGHSLGESDSGLANLAGPVGEMAGAFARLVFLLVFFLVVFSSIIGGFNGIAYLTCDGIRVLRGIPESQVAQHVSTRAPAFRAAVVFMLVATLVVSALGAPVQLVLLYAATGSLFLPLLAAALLWLLNRADVVSGLRNGPLANIVLVGALLLFGCLGGLQVWELVA
jgi:Mn2+/Fe2+ NRAMP family transporter